MSDSSDIERFVAAQQSAYERAVAELRRGQKRTHWMWFIFPQVDGLGQSAVTRYYAIRSRSEARAYLDHTVLGPRLRECASALFAVQGKSPTVILGHPDDMKLRSSMTLFALCAGSKSIFAQVLDKYFQGIPDRQTEIIWQSWGD